jgi:hypothetical protein
VIQLISICDLKNQKETEEKAMDNNNFNNDPNNAQTPNNGDYSAPQPSNPYQYNGSATTNTTAQPAADSQNTAQNPYGTAGTAQQNSYGTADAAQQNAYGTAGTAPQNPYGTAPQNPYGTSYSAYGTMNAAPLDKNGQPMKNNFGMKLTFSILEIVSALFCNILGLVMGILGCVFSSKANTAYKEGRWEDFKSAAKTATIVLWIGLAGVIIAVIAWIVIIATGVWAIGEAGDVYDQYYNDYTYDYDYDDDYDDDDDSDDRSDEAIVDNDIDSDDDQVVDEQESTVTVWGDIDFEDTVIYDSNGVTVTATSISWYEDYSGNQYPEINVVITNSSDKDVSVQCEYLSINGIAMDYPSMYCDVSAGLSAKDTVDCSYDDTWLYCDFDEIEYFTVCMNVYDEDYYDYSETYDFYTVVITDDAGLYGPTDSGSLILSQDGFDIYYLGTTEDDYGTGQFVFYIYNDTDMYVHANTDNLAADGFMQSNGYDSAYLYSYDGGLLFADADDDVDINSVSSASVKFEAYDM